MHRIRPLRGHCWLLGAVVVTLTVLTSAAYAQDVTGTVVINTARQSGMSMNFTATDDGIRIALSQPQTISIVWVAGPPPLFRMIQGGGQCMEIGEQAFQMMQQMQQSSGAGNIPEFAPGDVTFEVTEETTTIGPWTARAIHVSSGEPGEDGTVWFAPELDTGLFDLFTRMGDALDAMPLAGINAGSVSQYQQLWEAADLPDGGVVRINMNGTDDEMSLTLESLELGSFEDALAPPPGGCQQMPALGLPE